MTENIALSSGKQSFAPRARLVSVLGAQLIRDARVGLLELVRNAYDADATQVTIELKGLAVPESTEIIIEDNGSGMNKDTVLGKWLEPATGDKAEAKKHLLRSNRGRIPLGEKGVGRFAAHRLGRKLELITRAKESPEVVLTINWDDFENNTAYLSQIEVDWQERNPIWFGPDHTGTRMIMRNAREKWTSDDVRSISEGLKRLMSPFKSVSDFAVKLVCPEFPQYQELDPGDLLLRSHARFEGLVDDDGLMDGVYSFRLPGFRPREEQLDRVNLIEVMGKNENWGDVNRRPQCGGFFFNFYIWSRTPTSLNLTGTSKPELDAQIGVSIFRDGLRILPYGDKDDDWLSMDEQRYLRPGESLGRKSVVALIEINQVGNPNLRDKTSREGLIENRAFLDLRSLIRAVVTHLEIIWQTDRELLENVRKEKQQRSTRPAYEKLRQELQELETSTGLTGTAIEKVSIALEKGHLDASVAAELSQAISKLRNDIPTVQSVASDSTEKIEQVVNDIEDERDLLLGLAGIGLAAERFTHEFARLTREASDLIRRIRNTGMPPRALSDFDALSATIDALRNDIKALGPMFYVRRATREKELSILGAISNAKLLNQRAFDDAKIEFILDGDDFTVTMREGPLTQVFNNLFDNAAFWLSKKSDEKDRRLTVKVDASKREVIVSDNGPGVNPRYQARVFQPFFTTKTDGRGLGLYIVREILAEKKFSVRLLDAGDQATPRTGATFLIVFRDLPMGEENYGA